MKNWKTFFYFSLCSALIMTLVVVWDKLALNAQIFEWKYLSVKILTIGLFYLLAFHAYLTKKITWHQEIFAINFFLYSLYGMASIDMTYNFSFIEAFFILSLSMQTTQLRFIGVNVFGLLCLLAGFHLAAEPAFVGPGHSYKSHAMTISMILFIISMFVHYFMYRFQRKINELNERFALIGKQSSFLMHELKTPLNRLVSKSETAEDSIMQDIWRDAFKISSLVTSVETMIHEPEALRKTFERFEWSEIIENLKQDFSSYLTSMNIRIEFRDFNGTYFGNKYLLYQLMKNMVLNAIEAIGIPKEEGSDLTLSLSDSPEGLLLSVSNTNSTISPQNLSRIFDPHFTTKKNSPNKGMGLPLAKNIAQAHGGDISVKTESNRTTFVISLREAVNV